MKLDPSILRALSIDSTTSTTTVSSHGSSGFNATAKITTALKDGTGPKKSYFMKTSSSSIADAEIMFRGEHASLNAIHGAVPSLCPASLTAGVSEDGEVAFLVTEFLEMGGSSSSFSSFSSSSTSGGGEEKGSGLSLAAKLAKLHTTLAPVPEGYTEPMFGFPETTCCGDTAQPNGYMGSWADFYAKNRLLAILEKCERNQGKGDGEVRRLTERVAEEVVPRLIGDDHLNGGKGVTPVVVHGDLWSGNRGRGRIGGKGAVEDVVFDPSAVYGHSEYELGIMNMFGGFGKAFFDEYHKICPKTEPAEEYGDRVKLYELYHHMNHFCIFGGSYRSGAVSIMKSLLRKYGN